MTLLNPTRTPYLFDKDLAVHIVFAEVRHFAAGMNPNGRTEEEVQTLTRRLSWLTDRDLRWTEVDQMISHAHSMAAAETDHARGALFIELFWDISTNLGSVPTRWENAA
jgi:hypothetical protein